MDDSLGVDIFQSLNDAGHNEPSLFFIEYFVRKMIAKVSSLAVLHDHIQIFSVLERSLHVYYEPIQRLAASLYLRMMKLLQNRPL